MLVHCVRTSAFIPPSPSCPTLTGCDKNMPGCLMAMGRLNRPSIMVYGGTIRAGCSPRHDKLDIVSAFQVRAPPESSSRSQGVPLSSRPRTFLHVCAWKDLLLAPLA
jgi:hypothetical protein